MSIPADDDALDRFFRDANQARSLFGEKRWAEIVEACIAGADYTRWAAPKESRAKQYIEWLAEVSGTTPEQLAKQITRGATAQAATAKMRAANKSRGGDGQTEQRRKRVRELDRKLAERKSKKESRVKLILETIKAEGFKACEKTIWNDLRPKREK